MPGTPVHHAVPLGSLCLTAQVLQDMGVRSCSYPFDWMFADLDIVTDALTDGFVAFLDRSQYVDIGHPEACGHARYGRLFNHHDPLRNPEHHSYFVRCVERLFEVFRSQERKLFLVINRTPRCTVSFGTSGVLHFGTLVRLVILSFETRTS